MLVRRMLQALFLTVSICLSALSFAQGSWSDTESAPSPWYYNQYNATKLLDGRVFWFDSGNGMVYDPKPESWRTIRGFLVGGESCVTRLPDGRLLIVTAGIIRSFIFDPSVEEWYLTQPPLFPHSNPIAVALLDGKVLLTGPGRDVELFDPITESWSPTGSLNLPRNFQSVTLLNDGRVLAVGGTSREIAVTAELYDPREGTWSMTPNLAYGHAYHAATKLLDGTILVTGGPFCDSPDDCAAASAELYEPQSGTWRSLPPMSGGRYSHTETVLDDGRVLVTGGYIPDRNAEIFDPKSETWSLIPPMRVPRWSQLSIKLDDGRALVAGGAFELDEEFNPILTREAEIYTP